MSKYAGSGTVEYTPVDVKYLEWAGKTIAELKELNAELLKALKEAYTFLDPLDVGDDLVTKLIVLIRKAEAK